MNLQEAKEIVAQQDGYSNYDQIRESFQEEYTRRAYDLLMSKQYSGEEVKQLFIDRAKAFSTSHEPFNSLLLKQDLEWFEQNKRNNSCLE